MTWEILHGDCRDVLPTLGPVDHILADPPYSARTHEGVRSAGHGERQLLDGNGRQSPSTTRRVVDLGFDHLSPETRRAVARAAARLCRRWCLIFSDTESAWLWRISLEAAELRYVRTAFWDRIGGAPQFTGDRPAVACEAITVAHRPGRKAWNAGGKRGLYSFPIVANRSGHRTDRVHPTQKPLDLMRALVEDFTDPGDTVLDPFCGSASTGVACVQLGRHFIGVERDERWVETARARLQAEQEGSTLTAARAGQRALFAPKEGA